MAAALRIQKKNQKRTVKTKSQHCRPHVAGGHRHNDAGFARSSQTGVKTRSAAGGSPRYRGARHKRRLHSPRHISDHEVKTGNSHASCCRERAVRVESTAHHWCWACATSAPRFAEPNTTCLVKRTIKREGRVARANEQADCHFGRNRGRAVRVEAVDRRRRAPRRSAAHIRVNAPAGGAVELPEA